MTLPRTIVVATDFSEHADAALAYAVDLASRFEAKVHLVHAIGVPSMGVHEIGIAYNAMMIESVSKHAQQELDSRIAKYRERVPEITGSAMVGDARDIIDQTAERLGADLVVMGTHGRRGFRRFFLGSVAETVVRTAPCPVLTVRPPRRSVA